MFEFLNYCKRYDNRWMFKSNSKCRDSFEDIALIDDTHPPFDLAHPEYRLFNCIRDVSNDERSPSDTN